LPEELEYENSTNDVLDSDREKGILYDNELQFMSSSPECSYSTCSHDTRQNKLKLDWFKNKRGSIGQEYECWYNPANYTQVIAERHYMTVDIFHALFWPIAVLVIAIVSYCLVRRCHAEEKRARQRENEMRGIRPANPNTITDMKDRNYMLPIQTEYGVIPNGVEFGVADQTVASRSQSSVRPIGR
jgi:hypothetical protein